MRPNFNHNQQKNSQQIQMHIAQKAKSRNRVIGSVVVLLCALALLLNVTSNVKQININPSTVEIKNSAASAVVASAPIVVTNQNSSDVIANDSSSPITVSDSTQNSIVSTNSSQPTSDGFKAGVVSKTMKGNNVEVIATPTVPTKNKVVETPPKPTKLNNQNNQNNQKPIEKKAVKSNPEDILDGIADGLSPQPQKATPQKTTTQQSGKSYIQFAALSSEANANKLKQDLATHGVNASIQQIQTSKGILYRLRAGPFNSETATNKLQQLKANGYSGIVTGN